MEHWFSHSLSRTLRNLENITEGIKNIHVSAKEDHYGKFDIPI